MIELTSHWISFLVTAFQWSHWEIGSMKSWKCSAHCALFGQYRRLHCHYWIQHPENALRDSGDGHGTGDANILQLCYVCEFFCQECSEACTDS
jgi:hypothetical protein